MTIGIVCSGPNAGLGAFRALRAVERVATGAIGGFAVFAAITEDGTARTAETQRGGGATLFTRGERTGTPPPEAIARSRLAGLISSGPDRPAPLSRFLALDAEVGLVSGHRLPGTPDGGGRACNAVALAAMRGGATPEEAVRQVLEANPEADIGLIAADLRGRVFAANSARVARRPDLGEARREDTASGSSVAILHNAIGPGPAIAALAAETALAEMVPARPDAQFTVEAGTPVVQSDAAAVEIDAAGLALRVLTSDPALLGPRANGAAIYLGAEVRQQGRPVGYVAEEPNCTVADGRLVTMSGQSRLEIGYRRTSG